MDILFPNASLIDGTGSPSRRADVAVTGDRITEVAEPGSLVPEANTDVIDLGDLTLAPGFIDIHTHYDAQILWDGDLTPSSWHGVTTVVMGNCGFAVAPTRPEHRETIVRTFENVEGMSMEALNGGIDWCFETFPEYLDAIDDREKRLNVAAFLGHSTLRLFAMGGEEREATPEELDDMKSILKEALEAGAVGFSTSRQPNHQGAFGRPVPSRFAEVSEVYELASVMGEVGRGVMEVSIGPGLFVDQFSEMAVDYGIPVTWTALVARKDKPGAAMRMVERCAALPGEVYPQIACRPIVMQTSMADPAPLGEIDAIKEILAVPRDERAALYADAEWRERAREPALEMWSHRWHKIDIEETNVHGDLVGIKLTDLAEQRGTNPFDCMIDLALEDDLATRFRIVMDNDGDEELGDLLADKRTLLGLSDAGAHASQLCDACYSTHLLGHWVRERNALSLEDAVWRLTGHPHEAFRISERGLVAVGFHADLVAFDAETVGTTPVERVYDQPGGADRLLVQSTGVEHMWVNGVATRINGEDLEGQRPGRLIRD
jgi:N-acyl-D-aspartate/D-glutamate deacylase